MAHQNSQSVELKSMMRSMRTALSLAAVALCASPLAEATITTEVMPGAGVFTEGPFVRRQPVQNLTEDMRKLKRGPSLNDMEEEDKARKERIRERNERARQKLESYHPDPAQMTRMSKEEVDKMAEKDHPWMRGLSWGSSSSSSYADFLADPTTEYDKWAQAYRMVGGYIDCDHQKDGDDHHSGDNNNGDANNNACSRWMIWAAYVDENYSGNGYDEYYGDDAVGVLDCHDPDTSWVLLGIYRQEFYQFIEQISKHVWAVDEYDYVVALAGLKYMTDSDCWSTGDTDNNGNTIYAGVAPTSNGEFQMALYTDGGYCTNPNTNLGKTFDSYGFTSNIQLNKDNDKNNDGDDANDNDDAYGELSGYWQDAQEYTFTKLNEVYMPFRYCTSCVDYPTYQDGYFIGDDGTDDDDLINQCWKFFSHDSFTCDADCVAKAHAQGSILSVNYNGQVFGSTPSSFYNNAYSASGRSANTHSETKMTRLMANVFVAFSFIVFVATFLAFAVARRSRQREKRSSKSRRLLDEDGKSRSSRRHKTPDGDGLFRTRSKSESRRSGRKSSSKSRSKSRSSRPVSTKEDSYQPPKDGSRRSSSRSGSRRPLDDF